jgi:hypothetical protein
MNGALCDSTKVGEALRRLLAGVALQNQARDEPLSLGRLASIASSVNYHVAVTGILVVEEGEVRECLRFEPASQPAGTVWLVLPAYIHHHPDPEGDEDEWDGPAKVFLDGASEEAAERILVSIAELVGSGYLR